MAKVVLLLTCFLLLKGVFLLGEILRISHSIVYLRFRHHTAAARISWIHIFITCVGALVEATDWVSATARASKLCFYRLLPAHVLMLQRWGVWYRWQCLWTTCESLWNQITVKLLRIISSRCCCTVRSFGGSITMLISLHVIPICSVDINHFWATVHSRRHSEINWT